MFCFFALSHRQRCSAFSFFHGGLDAMSAGDGSLRFNPTRATPTVRTRDLPIASSVISTLAVLFADTLPAHTAIIVQLRFLWCGSVVCVVVPFCPHAPVRTREGRTTKARGRRSVYGAHRYDAGRERAAHNGVVKNLEAGRRPNERLRI